MPASDPPTLLPAPRVRRLLEWQQQKVWCNARPQEAAYPVQLQYADGSGSGRLKALPGPAALLAARDAAPLAGRTLLWLPPARDAGLQAAAEALGATSHDVAAAGRAPAAAKAAGAVLVRGRADDAVPAAYRRLPWTTPELLIVSAPGWVGGAPHCLAELAGSRTSIAAALLPCMGFCPAHLAPSPCTLCPLPAPPTTSPGGHARKQGGGSAA